MRLIVFGLGEVYRKIKQHLYRDDMEIVALLDSNPELTGSQLDGYVIDVPEHIRMYQYDRIVITSDHAVEMRGRLLELGIPADQVVHYRDYIGGLPLEKPVIEDDVGERNVLLLSNEFGYHGGPVACLNLTRILQQMGYRVTIAVPSAESDFVQEVSEEGKLQVIVIEELGNLSAENLEWTSQYTYVLANTVVMLRCALKISKKRKVYLWLHESVDAYNGYEYWHDEITEGIQNELLQIGAVSEVARKNFRSIYETDKEIEVMPYGIEDRYSGIDLPTERSITTFVVVAAHIELKGLDVLLEAISLLPETERGRYRVLLAGKACGGEYGESIRAEIAQNIYCEYFGELSRDRLFALYAKADVVVIPSRRDSLPIVATEAMMLQKPCIISDSTGTVKYIRHQYNGLIFHNEDRAQLAEMMAWCMENQDKLAKIGLNARTTYEKWFSMKKFGTRVMAVLESLD